MERHIAFSEGTGKQQKPELLRVVVLYENLDSGKHAKNTFQYLSETLEGICQCNSQFWKFNVLEDTRMNSLAVQDAANADIIMVASQGELELPTVVKTFFADWEKGHPQPLALVGIFEHPLNAAPVRDYLQQLAKKNGVEFFAQTGTAPPPLGGSQAAAVSPSSAACLQP